MSNLAENIEPQPLDPENQDHWRAIVDACAFTVTHIINTYNLESSSFFRYLRGDTKPKKHWERMVEIMKTLGGGATTPSASSFLWIRDAGTDSKTSVAGALP